MEKLLWFIIMIPVSAFFTGLGTFAWTNKKPMWFWSGSTVKESEISDIPAYNRANGIMWIVFSLGFWISAFIGIWNESLTGIMTATTCLVGIPMLIVVYKLIYKKYKV